MRLKTLGFLFCFGLLTPIIAKGEQIQVVDSAGRTQSYVELSEKGRATVKVAVRNASGLPSVGIQVSLQKQLTSGLYEEAQKTVTLDSGLAVFTDVPAGKYTFQIGCESFQIQHLSVRALQSKVTDNAVREQELLVVESEAGKELYAEPVLPGAASEITFSLQSTQSPAGLSARLLSKDTNEGSKIVAETKVQDSKSIVLRPVFPGSYTLKVDCGARVNSVSFAGNDIVKLFCAVGTGGTSLSALQALGVGSTSAGISTLGIVAGVAAVGGVAAAAGGGGGGGGGGAPDVTPTPQRSGIPTVIPTSNATPNGSPSPVTTGTVTPVPTSVATVSGTPTVHPSPTITPPITPTPGAIGPTPTVTPTLTIPGLAPTCPAETSAIRAETCRPSTAASKVKEEPLSPYQ